jgi:hypothetical protein
MFLVEERPFRAAVIIELNSRGAEAPLFHFVQNVSR